MKNKFYSLLFHVHTNHSADGLISPKLLLNYCHKNDIDLLIVTDHDSISSFEQLKMINSGNSIKLIPGIEFSTNLGDIIGIFIDKVFDYSTCDELIDLIHLNNGLVILPHPYQNHKLNQICIEKIDIIESFNARCTKEENYLAQQLCIAHNKPKISGCDAHLPSELKLVRSIYLDDKKKKCCTENEYYKNILLNCHSYYFGEYSNVNKILFSQIIKNFRKKDILSLIKNVLSLIYKQFLKIRTP
jgi:hypothetical protein